MTILFLGGEMGSVTPSSGDVYEVLLDDSGGAGTFDASNARCAIRIGTHVSYAQSTLHSGVAAVGYRWRGLLTESALSFEVTLFTARSSSADQVRVQATRLSPASLDTIRLDLQYLSSAAVWTSIGTYDTPAGIRNTYEVYVDKTGGDLRLYAEGAIVLNGSGLSLSHMNSFTHCRWYGVHGAAHYISELSGATTANAVFAVKTRYATGNSATNTAWAGDYTSIDEIVYSDADAISSSAGNDVETFTHSGPDLEAYTILAIGLGIRGKKGSTGPTGQQGCLRVSGTNYVSSTDTLGSGLSAFCPVWETNPATAAAWTGAAAEALEFGVKSIT